MISRFIERMALSALLGALFMFIATTVQPQWQTLVSPFACGEGASSFVVRYPNVAEPAGMVRNTPLVCVTQGTARLASPWAVLPPLAVVGTVTSFAAVVGGSLLRRAVSRLRSRGDTSADAVTRGEMPARRRAPLEKMRWLWPLIALPQVYLAAFSAYWWLAVDTPYRAESCSSSSGGSATCYDGEPVYRMMTGIFGVIAAVLLTVWIAALARSVRRERAYRTAWERGIRTRAVLVNDEPTSTRVNGGRVRKFTYRIDPVDGSAPFTFVERGFASPAGSVGGSAEAVYDPHDRQNAFTLAVSASGTGAFAPPPADQMSPINS